MDKAYTTFYKGEGSSRFTKPGQEFKDGVVVEYEAFYAENRQNIFAVVRYKNGYNYVSKNCEIVERLPKTPVTEKLLKWSRGEIQCPSG